MQPAMSDFQVQSSRFGAPSDSQEGGEDDDEGEEEAAVVDSRVRPKAVSYPPPACAPTPSTGLERPTVNEDMDSAVKGEAGCEEPGLAAHRSILWLSVSLPPPPPPTPHPSFSSRQLCYPYEESQIAGNTKQATTYHR